VVKPPTAEIPVTISARFWTSTPTSVAEILRRDPSLMARADYMAAYPDLQAFISSIPRSRATSSSTSKASPSWQNPRRLDPSFEALGVLLGGMAAVFLLILFATLITWLVRAFIQHRRWLRRRRCRPKSTPS
jgi:hypothetical protein